MQKREDSCLYLCWTFDRFEWNGFGVYPASNIQFQAANIIRFESSCNTPPDSLRPVYLPAFRTNFNGGHITSQLQRDKLPTLDPAAPLPVHGLHTTSRVHSSSENFSLSYVDPRVTAVSHELARYHSWPGYLEARHETIRKHRARLDIIKNGKIPGTAWGGGSMAPPAAAANPRTTRNVFFPRWFKRVGLVIDLNRG